MSKKQSRSKKPSRKIEGSNEFFHDCEAADILPSDFTPPDWLLARMKISWPEFVRLCVETPYGTQGELLAILAHAAGISRAEAAFLAVGLYDGNTARTGLIWLSFPEDMKIKDMKRMLRA